MNANNTYATNDVDPRELLAVAAERAVPVVAGIDDKALAEPTPCADYDVKALVNHLFQVVVEFQKLAVKQDSDFSTMPDRVAEGPDWRERFAGQARALVAAWSGPGALDGTSGAMKMPARLVAGMALLDLTVHAWDLARATGQEYEAEPRVVAELAGAVDELSPTARKMGVFGPPVEVPGDASPFARLLAATGRDPRQG
ncbi:TIGR03086 family metal-binding protein [Streptomyces sp. VRA16 Mangrove soil]|uniref:TIGR03086 family metal-binding protein n=1 Tax=Streptomyces sp. VRA16 Mangrove soil TaxID=2817434 RepID=UPI001A9E0EBF|nr:TIGR03086 family metal-binding protein [Streptomyces sp. VRA16 Mangrove soil]MBO1337816.1 TIGR03086 family protein [Streptomyces sp. VRA16 Mangrove soil]